MLPVVLCLGQCPKYLDYLLRSRNHSGPPAAAALPGQENDRNVMMFMTARIAGQ